MQRNTLDQCNLLFTGSIRMYAKGASFPHPPFYFCWFNHIPICILLLKHGLNFLLSSTPVPSALVVDANHRIKSPARGWWHMACVSGLNGRQRHPAGCLLPPIHQPHRRHRAVLSGTSALSVPQPCSRHPQPSCCSCKGPCWDHPVHLRRRLKVQNSSLRWECY